MKVKDRIIKSFSSEALDLFEREFRFFDKVTDISGALYPLPKEKRRAGIRRFAMVNLLIFLLWSERNWYHCNCLQRA